MKFLYKNLEPVLFVLLIASAGASQPEFKSDIFTYEDPINARNLHVSMHGDNWSAEDAKSHHLQFYQDLFGNPTVMAKFGSGKPMGSDRVASFFNSHGLEPFDKGNPDGLLLISDHLEQPFMHILAGRGDRPGASELQYAMMPDHWGKRYGEKVVATLVQEWAPEVSRIGCGIGLDGVAHAHIIKVFQCFEGKPLDQIYACASPANPGSVKILEKVGFNPASYHLKSTAVAIDFDQREFDSLQAMDNELLKLFDPTGDLKLIPSQHYRMIDPDGKERTVSLRPEWGQMRYHVEYKVTPK